MLVKISTNSEKIKKPMKQLLNEQLSHGVWHTFQTSSVGGTLESGVAVADVEKMMERLQEKLRREFEVKQAERENGEGRTERRMQSMRNAASFRKRSIANENVCLNMKMLMAKGRAGVARIEQTLIVNPQRHVGSKPKWHVIHDPAG